MFHKQFVSRIQIWRHLTIIPNVQGSPIIIVVNNENDILLLAVRVSFFVINADTDGTSAVANAILNDNKIVAISSIDANETIKLKL